MKRMSILVLATLTLAGCGGGNMPFATPHDTENTASGPNSNVVAPAGATFFDDFSKGSLDTSKWIVSNWGAPGGGKFVPSYLDFSSGMLRAKFFMIAHEA